MIVWLVAGFLLVVLAWVFAQRGSAEPSTIEPVRERAHGAARGETSHDDRGHKTPPQVSAANLIDWSNESPKIPAIPSLVEDDELEITVVTASPFMDSNPAKKAPEKPSDDDPTKTETSRVEVIYEEEAEVEEITSPVARILLSAQGQSDGGLVRKRNEDSMLVFGERSLFAVADGMGGYEGGQVASAIAVETLRSSFDTNEFDGKTESDVRVPRRGRDMACAIQMANHAILAKARANAELAQMGTTIVAARFSPNKQRVYIGHVGDSRCYRLRGKTLRQLTTDHTMSQLGMKGPGSNHLYQAVGIGPKITIDLIVDKPRANDVYVLCSDGLSKMASDAQIRDMLVLEPDIDSAVESLIALANDQGGKDNVTVILVKVVEETPMTIPRRR